MRLLFCLNKYSFLMKIGEFKHILKGKWCILNLLRLGLFKTRPAWCFLHLSRYQTHRQLLRGLPFFFEHISILTSHPTLYQVLFFEIIYQGILILPNPLPPLKSQLGPQEYWDLIHDHTCVRKLSTVKIACYFHVFILNPFIFIAVGPLEFGRAGCCPHPKLDMRDICSGKIFDFLANMSHDEILMQSSCENQHF